MTMQREGQFVVLDAYHHSFLETWVGHAIPNTLTPPQVIAYVEFAAKQLNETLTPVESEPETYTGMVLRRIFAHATT